MNLYGSTGFKPAVPQFGARKLSQETLMRAVQQIGEQMKATRADQAKQARQARRVAKEFAKELNLDPRFYGLHIEQERDPADQLILRGVALKPMNYRIVIEHSTYFPGAPALSDLVKSLPDVKVRKDARVSPSTNESVSFEWDISGYPQFPNSRQKKFPIRFESYIPKY